jgi:uncharacterized cupredoxin-like copper-binding protein
MLNDQQSRVSYLLSAVFPILFMIVVSAIYLLLTALAFGVSFVGSVKAQPIGRIWFWTTMSTMGIPMSLAFYFGSYLNKRIFGGKNKIK